MKKLLLLFTTAIVTVALGSCTDGMKKNDGKNGTSYVDADKNGRLNRKCPNGQCPMKSKKMNGRYDSKMERERMERRW